MSRVILGLGTAVPPAILEQDAAAAIAADRCCDDDQQRRWLLRRYQQAGVARRHVAAAAAAGGEIEPQAAFSTPAGMERFYRRRLSPDDLGPTTAERMRAYERLAWVPALDACRAALADAGVAAGQISRLVTVSCTGAVSPGLSERLVKELGLKPGVGRATLGFMGCHGGFNGLQVADESVAARPGSRVLVCCVELCSLHFQYGWDRERVVANALFGDGASAYVVGDETSITEDGDAERRADRAAREGGRAGQGPAKGWRMLHAGSRLMGGCPDAMTWRIGDHGFRMTLDRQVPALIERELAGWLADELGSVGLQQGRIDHWLTHPGGPAILEAVAAALGLAHERHELSRRVLGTHGNMSSATLGFLLAESRARGFQGRLAALGFGPGLVAELLVVEKP